MKASGSIIIQRSLIAAQASPRAGAWQRFLNSACTMRKISAGIPQASFFAAQLGLAKHTSLSIAREAIAKDFAVIYGSTQNLLHELEEEHFGRRPADEGAMQEMLLSCDLLILDDLGAEFSTSFTVAALYNIINSRINAGLPVIISTNLTPTELEAKYTQRITSRIIGCYTSLIFCGRDIRQLKR